MTTTDDLRHSRRHRPRAVTIAVVLWAVWLVVGVVATVVVTASGSGLTGAGAVLAVALSCVLWAVVAAAVLLLLRGSPVARIVLVAVAALRALLSISDGLLSTASILLSVVAVVLLFVPSARPFFRRAGDVEPRRASRP